MANHGHHKLGLFLLAMMICKGFGPSLSNQRLPSLWDLPVIWSLDQFDQTPSIDTTDSSLLQHRSFLVMSIQGNCDLLPCRRLVFGAFSRCRWMFRLSTGDFPLTRGYGGFIWVFDPGINRVLAEEDVINLVIDEITSLYLMEMKKNFQAKWVTSPGLVALFLFGEDAEYDSDYSFSNSKTEKSRKPIRREAIHKTTSKLFLGLRLEEFLALMEFLQVCLVFRFNFGCNTNRMTGSTSGVLVKEANTTWRIVMDQKTASMFTMDLMAETYGVWYYIIAVEVKEEDDTFQFEHHKFNDPNKQRFVSPLPQMPLPDVLKEARSERKRFLTPHPRRMESEKGMKPKLSHKNSFEKRSFKLRSPSGPIRDLGTLGIQERVKSKKDTGCSMRRWSDVKSSNWPFTSLDWVLVYLGTQVLSREVTSVFKTSILEIRQRRLPDDHSESMPKSSIILISTEGQDTSLFSTTSVSHFKSKVMPNAFWSLSYKLLANNKYVKEGHNRLFHLLAWQTSERIAWLLSTLSSKLFQFPIFAYNGCIVLVLYFVNSF